MKTYEQLHDENGNYRLDESYTDENVFNRMREHYTNHNHVRMTNYDRIRNMSVEEMADLIGRTCRGLEDCCYCPAADFCHKNSIELACCGCEIVILNWLESEVTK